MTTGNLSIQDNDTLVQYTSVGETDFVFPFPILESDELKVSRDQVLLTFGVDYSITGLGDEGGGTITLLSGASTPGQVFTLWQDMPIERLTGFSAGAATILGAALNAEFAARLRVEQQLRREIRNCVRIPTDDPVGSQDMELPASTARAGKFLGFDANGLPIALSGTGNDSAFRTDAAAAVAGAAGARLIGYRRNATGSIARTVQDVLDRTVRLLDFGADPTGVADCKGAFDSAIAACAALNHATLIIEPGMYRFASAPANIGYGIMLMGEGSQGTTEPYGTVLLFDYNGDGLTWDGSGGAGFRGTGGGAQNLTLLAANGRTGGRCIYLLAQSSNNRPGEMVFHNVLSFGQGSATWAGNIEIDGRLANTPGSKGVRTVRFSKVRVADCATANKNVWLRQGVHISGSIDIDTGNGTPNIGITVDDDWDNVQLGAGRWGNVTVNFTGAGTAVFEIAGRCSSFDCNSAAILGDVHLANYGLAGTFANASPFLRIQGNTVDSFFAHRSATVANQTGDGTTVSVVFDVESFDDNATYDNATGLATFRCAGKYQVDWGLVLTNLGAAHTTGELLLRHRDSGGTLKNSISHKFGVGPMRDAANQCSLAHSKTLSVAEGDTMDVRIMVSGSTLTVGIGGAAATRYGGFSARLLA